MMNAADRHVGSDATGMLVVDLDGTLLRSDMLYETFWSAVSRDWRIIADLAGALRSGRVALKSRLANAGPVEAASLPYNQAVIDRITDWRARGGRTALVTASDHRLAKEVAAHLGLFDEVHGSDGASNMKGPTKAAFLADRYGTYTYMGDSAADLPVWAGAARAVTVDAPPRLRARADALGRPVEHLTTAPSGLRPYLKALRPHQWLKNILVFLPMLAAHQIDAVTLAQSVLAFVAFSLVASSVYVLNDLLDLSADRAHPRKRTRPFASGTVPIAHGAWMAGGGLVAGIAIAVFLGGPFLFALGVYYLVTMAYSLHLKRRIVIDICVLAGLYTMRIIAGGAATGLPPSEWLLALSVFIFLSLAAIKRQAELVDNVARGTLSSTGRGYHVDDLPLISQVAMSAGYVAVLVMALYINSPKVAELYPYPVALWGICPILLYWITRMVMVTHRGRMHDDPIVYAISDRVSRICGALIAVLAVGGVVL